MASTETCSRNQTETEELIAELCIHTDDDDIKQVLKKYQYGSDISTIERKLKSGNASKIDTLRKVLEFLNNTAITEDVPRKRDDIAHAIVCRIQNLLPDDCNLCNNRFKLLFTEHPILPCARCGQSSHRQCLFDIINTKNDKNFTSFPTDAEITKIINPLNLPGVHYLCSTCEAHIIPDTHPPAQSQTVESPNQNEIDNAAEPQMGVSPNQSEIDNADIPASSESEQHQNDDALMGELPTLNPTEHSQQNDDESPPREAREARTHKKRTCKFYKWGSCRYGINGEGCKFDHPELCKKFTQHGTRQPRGCNKGKECKYLHPQMCMNSLRSGKCATPRCRYRHIKGTKIVDNQSTTTATRTSTAADQTSTATTHKKHTTPADTPAAQSAEQQPINQSDHFLEVFRLLKAELLQEMNHMITKQLTEQVQLLPRNQVHPMQLGNPQHLLMPPGLQQQPQMDAMSFQQAPTQFQLLQHPIAQVAPTPLSFPPTMQAPTQLHLRTQQTQFQTPMRLQTPQTAQMGL